MFVGKAVAFNTVEHLKGSSFG